MARVLHQLEHLISLQRLQLPSGHQLWVLEVVQEILDLRGKEAIAIESSLLLFLLLDLNLTDFITDATLQIMDLLANSLVENHDIGKKVELHLISLPFKFKNRLAVMF